MPRATEHASVDKTRVYWVLKCVPNGTYRIWPDGHGSSPFRKYACKFARKQDASAAKKNNCCPDMWTVFRVTIKTDA